MAKKGVFFFCANSFLAVIILSQTRDFLLVRGCYGSFFRGEWFHVTQRGRESRVCSSVSHPTKSPWHLSVSKKKWENIHRLKAGWQDRLNYFFLARCHSYFLCIQQWRLSSHFQTRAVLLHTKKLLYFNSSAENQWIISGYLCQWDIFITKCLFVWIIYHETIITTAPVENYMVMQHWKEFELSIMPCRFAVILVNLTADMLLKLSTKGRNFVLPNIHLLSMHKPRKGPETYI